MVVAENYRNAQEQMQRENRLRELEESQQKGFYVMNPIKTIKTKQEIKKLKKEIDEYRRKTRTKLTTVCLLCFLLMFMCFVGVMAIIENNSLKSNGDKETSSITNFMESVKSSKKTDISDLIETETQTNNPTSVVSENDVEQNKEEKTSILTEVIEPTVNIEVATSESTSNMPENEVAPSIPKDELIETESETENNNSTTDSDEKNSESKYLDITATDVQVRYETDYAHTDSEIIFLGNDEGVTISITIYRTGVSEEDLIIVYDDELLNVDTEGLISSDSKTTMELYVTGKTECETNIVIGTSYDWETFGEEADGYALDIRKLNANDGRIVYASSTGKYHFSSKCAGGSAKKSTYRDALIYEYDACKKCAN